MTAIARPANFIKAAIVIFWLVMLFLLVHRIHLIPRIELPPSEELSDSESWMSIYFQGQKVGFTERALARTQDGYLLNQNTYMLLNLMGQVEELRTLTSARLSEDMAVVSFNFLMSAGPVRYQLSGQLNGLEFELVSTTGGNVTHSKIRLEEVPRLAAGLMPYLTRHGLEVGRKFKVPIFDPSTLSAKAVVVAVEDKEKLLVDGETIEAFRIRMDYMDTQSYTWVDSEGRTIKEEGLLGLSMVRTTEEKAKEGIVGRADLADLVAATSAPTTGSIADPRQTRYLKARLRGIDLSGFELDGGRQRLEGDIVEVFREKVDVTEESVPDKTSEEFASYLTPDSFIQSRHPKIIHQARTLAGGIKSPLEIVERITNWVFESLVKRPTMSVPSAVDVLETKVGDCNEHAVLSAALLRAAGVPTRVAVGVLYYSGRFYYHAWIEVYWGQWMAVDPLLGQIPADATHIRFLTGGLDRQTEMIRVIGRLEVDIIESR